MKPDGVDRREFMKLVGGSAVMISALPQGAFAMEKGRRSPQIAQGESKTEPSAQAPPRIKFAVIGINHYHIYSQVEATMRGGGKLVWLYAKEPDLAAPDEIHLYESREQHGNWLECMRSRQVPLLP